MSWKVRELRSKDVHNANLNENEKELIQLYVNTAVKQALNTNNRSQYYDGIQTGIAQALNLTGRNDIWDLIDYEFPYHPELN